MASKKTSPLGGTIIVMVVVAVLVPPVLLEDTAKFRETFKEKCKGYQIMMKQKTDEKICENALNTIEKAFVEKNEKKVSPESYEGVFKDAPFTHPRDKTMFWTGTNDLVHKFTETRDNYFTQEDTLIGYVMNGLQWCGKENSKEIFMTGCSKDKPNAVSTFWDTSSAKVAQYASETVTVMLDGERPKPYFEGSVFAKVEVPNLSAEVKKLVVVLVVQKQGNKCNNQSLKDLEGLLKSKHIDYDCKEVTQATIEKCIEEKKTGSCW